MRVPSNSTSKDLPFLDRYFSEKHDNFSDLEGFLKTSRPTMESQSSTPLGPPFMYVMVRERVDNYNPTLGHVLGFKKKY